MADIITQSTNCILQMKECFIAKKPWRELCRYYSFRKKYGKSAHGPIPSEFLVAVDEYLLGMADLSWIFKDIVVFHTNIRHHVEVNMEHRAKLQAKCEQHLAAWEAWLRKMTPIMSTAVEVPIQQPGSIFSTRLEFGNPWTGMVFTLSWASSFFLKKALEVLDPTKYSHFEEETRKLRLDILRSVASLGTGISAPFRISLISWIIFDFINPTEQAWLKQVISRLKPLYGSFDENAYSAGFSTRSRPMQDDSTAVGPSVSKGGSRPSVSLKLPC